MIIRVVYHDNTCDTIPFFMLQLGIDCKKIKMFYRDSERRWVTVGADPVRMAAHVSTPCSSSERHASQTTKSGMH